MTSACRRAPWDNDASQSDHPHPGTGALPLHDVEEIDWQLPGGACPLAALRGHTAWASKGGRVCFCGHDLQGRAQAAHDEHAGLLVGRLEALLLDALRGDARPQVQVPVIARQAVGVRMGRWNCPDPVVHQAGLNKLLELTLGLDALVGDDLGAWVERRHRGCAGRTRSRSCASPFGAGEGEGQHAEVSTSTITMP